MKNSAYLIYNADTKDERVIPLEGHLAIGRRPPRPGSRDRIAVQDPMISGEHCIVTHQEDGRVFVRDVSRNGTKVDGRRLVPHVETELLPGSTIQLGPHTFLLEIDEATGSPIDEELMTKATEMAGGSTPVTILVGDIKGWTTLNQMVHPSEVLASVTPVFQALEQVIVANRGTVKEYQGDAIYAFWEGELTPPFTYAADACSAALACHRLAGRLATDPSVWHIQGFPLQMDWALSSGLVSITSDRRGLSVVGETVKHAFDLEKLANEQTGPIVACQTTHLLARSEFKFRPLGDLVVPGRTVPEPIFALLG